MIRVRLGHSIWIGAIAAIVLTAHVSAAGAPEAPTPFARVYLALRGCTSCAHCRTTIRQMAKGGAKGGETHVDGGQVEVLYRTPRIVPLRDVIRSLAENRLHDLDLVDVLFEARGTIASNGDGTLRFTLDGTGQTFPVSLPASLARPADGHLVRLVAVVNGWREKGGLTLAAREVRPAA
jgi:hypothetical protein